MKLKSILVAAFAVMAALSCSKTETGGGSTPVNPGKGLLDFHITIPGNPVIYSATKKGPYAPEEVITVKLPSSEESPLDVTNLQCSATFDNNCYADPAVPPVLDFTYPYRITVVNAKGEKQSNTIQVELVYPKIKVSEVWQIDATTSKMNLNYTQEVNIAVDNNYVYVLDAALTADGCIRVFGRGDGAFVKTIDLPTSYIGQICVDDAGHLCCNRVNIYGAGVRFYIYDSSKGTWSGEIIDYVAGQPGCPATLPDQLGARSSITGDVTGTAYFYVTAPDGNEYYCWKFTAGVPSASPEIKTWGGIQEPWSYATVRRSDANVGADVFLAGFKYVAAPNEDRSYTYFQKLKSTGDVVTLNPTPDNIGYRIFNFKTFKIKDYELLALTSQYGVHRFDGCQFKVFDITDESKWNLKPGDAGYNNEFCIYYSGIYGSTNYNMAGNIDVRLISADQALIFASNPSREAGTAPSQTDREQTTVTCYKVEVKD